MRALIITEETKRKMHEACERARDKPIPMETLRRMAVAPQKTHLTLEDRGDYDERPMSECVEIDIGYRFCVSYEQQPAGLTAHFSVSVDSPGKVPSSNALLMIMDAIGYDALKNDSAWTEEFTINGKPGGLAVNLLFTEKE